MCVYDISWHVEALLLRFSICAYVCICMRMYMCVHICVYRCMWLLDQEIVCVYRCMWFLDQEIPAGGFVRIQDSSQVWEERVDETRIITTEGLSTCLDPGWGWKITSGGWNFLKKQECWEGHEQVLITIIRKETKRKEELEEAGYRSPTWAVLRALQQINSATRIEDSEQEKESWLEESSTMHNWACGASQTKGRRKSAHLSSSGKKSSLTMMKQNRKRKRTKRTGAKRRHIAGRAYNTGRGGSKATSKWQWARITLHAGFTKISLSQQNKFRLCWQQRGRQAERTNVNYDWQVSSWNTGWAQRSAD